ncbi:MAG TPA: sulfatase [Planctomycetota bacterium]
MIAASPTGPAPATAKPSALGAAALGARSGLGLALIEIGVLFPLQYAGLLPGLQRLLFFLVPLGLYPAVGAAAGGSLALLARRLPGLPWLRFLAAAVPLTWLVAQGGFFVGRRGLSRLDGADLVYPAAGILLAAALLLVRPLQRAAWPRRLVGGALAGLVAMLVVVAVFLAGTASAVLLGPPPVPARAGSPDVVLITWDTVRADVLSIHGGAGIATPNLDRLAAEALVLEQMIAVAPITGPSHASLLTGQMPPSHGLRSNIDTVIDAGIPSLAESFRAAGYDTAAFVSAYPLRGRFGFDRGFRTYDDRFGTAFEARVADLVAAAPVMGRFFRVLLGGVERTRIPGAVVVERAGDWLRRSDRPVFLWLHFFDAHGPFDPAPEWREKAAQLAAGATPPPADPERSGVAMQGYRAQIMVLDELLGDFRAVLEERDPGLARTAVLLTADHGECFGEGGYITTHAPSLLDATQHVPAVLRLPGARGGGLRSAELASQVDVAATLAAIAQIAPPAGQQGTSLLPLFEGRTLQRERFADGFYIEAYLSRLKKLRSDDRKIGLRTAEWKYWQWAGEPGRERLFRLADGEVHDLAAELPAKAAELRAQLGHLLADLPRAQERYLATSGGDEAALQELGYAEIQGGESAPKDAEKSTDG